MINSACSKKLLSLLALMVFTFFLEQGHAQDPNKKISLEEKQEIIRILRTTFPSRWQEGFGFVQSTRQEFFRTAESNHAHEYPHFDPIGEFYGFSAGYNNPANDLLLSEDPIAILHQQLADLISIKGHFGLRIEQDVDVASEFANIAIGIYIQADLLKGVTIGRSQDLNDMQYVATNKVLPLLETISVDPTVSSIVLKYFRARQGLYHVSLLYEVANTLQQTALQKFGKIEINDYGVILPKKDYTAEDQLKFDSLQIVAANYWAMAVVTGSENKDLFTFISPEFARYGALNNSLGLADLFKLEEIQRKLLPKAIANAKLSGNWDRYKELETNLISISETRLAQRSILDRVLIQFKKILLIWENSLVALYIFGLCGLFLFMSWTAGPQRSALRLYLGIKIKIHAFLDTQNTTLSLLDRIFLWLFGIGLGSLIPLLKDRADLILQSLLA